MLVIQPNRKVTYHNEKALQFIKFTHFITKFYYCNFATTHDLLNFQSSEVCQPTRTLC